MLGNLARAEEIVQEAWIRWSHGAREVESPKAFLTTMVTRLCLDELGSARARKEESRGDRLPEPVDLSANGFDRVARAEQLSMAFLVLLQRLTPSERAVLLLHDVFEMSHQEIAELLRRSEASCRQMLARAKENVGSARRSLETTHEEHRRLLAAFVEAMAGGDQRALVEILAEDATFIGDAGPEGGRFGRIRNAGRRIVGRTRVIALVKAIARQGVTLQHVEEHLLNGEPAFVSFRDGRAVRAIFVATESGKIRAIYVHADKERLKHLVPRS